MYLRALSSLHGVLSSCGVFTRPIVCSPWQREMTVDIDASMQIGHDGIMEMKYADAAAGTTEVSPSYVHVLL